MRLSSILSMACLAFASVGPLMEANAQQSKVSSPESLLPGKWLNTSDEYRKRSFQQVKQIAAKSKADIEPIQSRHVTLWAAKDNQRMYLADIEKVERFFRTKCPEPMRSGLDKRSAHIILLNDDLEYQAWLRAMFDLRRFADSDVREELLKGPANYASEYVAISLQEECPDVAHREVVTGVGSMYFSQLGKVGPVPFGLLQTGFINWTETAVFGGFPTIVFHSPMPRSTKPCCDGQDWNLLVRERLSTNTATPLGALLEMNTSMMLQPHYAEGWTLVELLASKPSKFGKLLLTLREGYSELAAINSVYGWDEKRLTKEWRAFVMTRGVKAKK